jgi:tetratricopeptide (TPR) repeat protein
MDDSLPAPHMSLSFFYCFKREYDKAIAEGERGVALYPSGSEAYGAYAAALLFACRPEEAIPLLQKAIRLNPNANPITFVNFGYALLMTGRFEEAVSAFKKALQPAPDDIIAHVLLASTYGLMGREKEARAEAAEVLRINPKFSLDQFAPTITYKDQARTDLIRDALRKAGLK